MYNYISMLVFGKFPHEIIFEKFTETNIDVLFKRNLHGVPRKAIERMHNNIQKMVPNSLSVHKILASGGIRKYHQFVQNSSGAKLIYLGVFFDSTTESTLRKKITEESQKELLTNKINIFHVTTSFAPQIETVQKVSLGKKLGCLLLVAMQTNTFKHWLLNP